MQVRVAKPMPRLSTRKTACLFHLSVAALSASDIAVYRNGDAAVDDDVDDDDADDAVTGGVSVLRPVCAHAREGARGA